jgi:hypothetical protein
VWTGDDVRIDTVAASSRIEDLRLAEEAGMVFPEAVVEEVEAETEVDELEVMSTAQLREKCRELGVSPAGDKRKAEVCGGADSVRAARGAVQQAAVARRVVVEDEQEDAAEDEAVVSEEDLSDEEADSAGPVKWVVPAWEVLAADRGGWRAGLEGLWKK